MHIQFKLPKTLRFGTTEVLEVRFRSRRLVQMVTFDGNAIVHRLNTYLQEITAHVNTKYSTLEQVP
jgi:hypothetical protein